MNTDSSSLSVTNSILKSPSSTNAAISTSSYLYQLHLDKFLSQKENINKSMKSKSQMRTRESTPRLPLSSERSVYLTKLIADFIIYNYLPLSIVESP
ncbi:unnamed protein product [Rotaria sp. Silwood1]|nr:unnamed protein product [Rotaria sp. Silwood1]CAF1282447.1 unnamed protein product [Rotaria sp. Silwood1]CAF3552021.1 unnamed protein product [Rotaria sp. Silwood1]CAF4978798.1 unnamed protein product [Rotaria sp. Silwood1]